MSIRGINAFKGRSRVFMEVSAKMTLKDLSQLYYLTAEIDADQRRLDRLTADRAR